MWRALTIAHMQLGPHMSMWEMRARGLLCYGCEHKNAKKQINKSATDYDRHTQSDTEQIITEKQKKRRRPKRISRTTQTYERYFRHRDDEQPEELRPTNDTDKSIQTRKSQLRPKPKSPRKHYPIYLSADAFKLF